MEMSLNDASLRKESLFVALPTFPSRDDCLPMDAMPEDPTPDEIQRACSGSRLRGRTGNAATASWCFVLRIWTRRAATARHHEPVERPVRPVVRP